MAESDEDGGGDESESDSATSSSEESSRPLAVAARSSLPWSAAFSGARIDEALLDRPAAAAATAGFAILSVCRSVRRRDAPRNAAPLSERTALLERLLSSCRDTRMRLELGESSAMGSCTRRMRGEPMRISKKQFKRRFSRSRSRRTRRQEAHPAAQARHFNDQVQL